MTESNSPKSQPKTSGGRIFIVVYLLCLIGMYFISTPKETKDFKGVAKGFIIVGFVKTKSPENPEYKIFSLAALRSGNVDLSDITFLLPEKAITSDVGDIHPAKILEDHGEWQLVKINYSYTRMSTSIYRAYKDRIEPVSWKLKFSLGIFLSAIILFLPAFIVSIIIRDFLNWHARRAIRDENA